MLARFLISLTFRMVQENKCIDMEETKCTTVYEEQCKSGSEKKCSTVYDTVGNSLNSYITICQVSCPYFELGLINDNDA